ncbi:MAG: hypothetical protein WCF93_02775 [Candidatus Moraniibacteriota bacterium]
MKKIFTYAICLFSIFAAFFYLGHELAILLLRNHILSVEGVTMMENLFPWPFVAMYALALSYVIHPQLKIKG